MEIIESVKEMQARSGALRKDGQVISLVPTMGYLHEGHLALMRVGRKRGDCLVVSIYVNPAQFSPGEDFERYPRDFERDCELCREVGVDIIFCPGSAEMYPEGYLTYVNVEEITRELCGLTRPNYFRGVTTICAKLFNIVHPHLAIFGKKDFQQYQVIRQMVRDLNMEVEIIGLATVREKDGLAMSSRNVYLNDRERAAALSLSRSLLLARDMYAEGERDALTILAKVKKMIESEPATSIDYARIVGTATMREVTRIDGEAVIALAVKVGKTRLIDNHVFGEDLVI
ncbi:MAG: pantoate--beta-alanine ligase [Smithellaceae bacterium]|nr:pantoate--beta-alanine ligase [Smithellaceae bacterium]